MAFVEDMGVFFNTAEFAVSATFNPATNAAFSVNVLFDIPQTEELFGADQTSDEYTITAKSADVSTVRSGDRVQIGADTYKIRFWQYHADGALRKAKLTKI